ncbi:MAG: hypothetical protein LBI84_06660 [Propionibacteriaceae bacterium]|nr:hypothetical protein [Propionibacteriaceae bacterium]
MSTFSRTLHTLPRQLRVFTSANPVSALRDLMNHGNFSAEAGWALLGCA